MAALALGLGTALAGSPRRGEGPGPPPWRVNGRVGFTADVAAFPDSAGYALEVYVRVTPATLLALSRDAGGLRRLRLSARLGDLFGARRLPATQEFEIDPRDSSGGFGKVVVLRFPAQPGLYKLQLKVEDLHSRKRGISYIGRRVTEAGSVEGEVEIPEPQAGRDLSDVEFAWPEDWRDRGLAFRRSGHTVLPNPERLYGLFAPQLRVFFEARARAGDERPWRWIGRLIDAEGRVVAERESSAAAGRWLDAGLAMDVSREPAGGYDLEVKAWQEGDAGALLRRAHLSIAWHPDSWLRNPVEVQDDVHFLLSAAEEDSFALMHPGEQERYVAEFWRVRDPTPDTPENEARDTYLQRVAIANRTYDRSGFGRGMFTDMGRIFIRYGEPSEVFHEVIPVGNNTLREVIQELSVSEDRPMDEIFQKGGGGDIRPFEVWIYDGEIHLPPDADPRLERNPVRRRLVFLFVDEQGIGDFRLRYSTE